MSSRPLRPQEVAARLVELPGWRIDRKASVLSRRYYFPDNACSLAFADFARRVADVFGVEVAVQAWCGDLTLSICATGEGLEAIEFDVAKAIEGR